MLGSTSTRQHRPVPDDAVKKNGPLEGAEKVEPIDNDSSRMKTIILVCACGIAVIVIALVIIGIKKVRTRRAARIHGGSEMAAAERDSTALTVRRDIDGSEI
jgi:hypothetical protein